MKLLRYLAYDPAIDRVSNWLYWPTIGLCLIANAVMLWRVLLP